MPLVELDLPSPAELRGGWAAMAAVCTARGWDDVVYALPDQWCYHDGGGNWACLRFQSADRAILLGHDHEYSETYFGKAADYFDEEETNLLAEAPQWWADNLNPQPFGEWIGFVYGWNGQTWQRARYDCSDGFEDIGLLRSCSWNTTVELAAYCSEAPRLNGRPPNSSALTALVKADANVTRQFLDAVVPGWDIDAGITAAQKFLAAPV